MTIKMEINKKIKKLYCKNNLSIRKISKLLNISEGKIYYIIKKNNLKKQNNAKKYYYITSDLIKNAYNSNRNLTLAAKSLNIPVKAFRGLMKNYNIPIRTKHETLILFADIKKEDIKILHDQNYTLKEIGKIYNTTRKHIYWLMKLYNIPRRSSYKSRQLINFSKGRQKIKTNKYVSKDILYDLYLNKKYTKEEISNQLKITLDILNKFFKKYKIKNISRTGVFAPSWKGGKIVDVDGKILCWKPKHPYSNNGYVAEHRLVMEKCLNRYLTPNEIVHHIDNNPSNNNIKNLKLCVSQTEHMEQHYSKNDY